MKWERFLIITFMIVGFASAEAQTHAIPFASSGNIIELAIANESSVSISTITIEARYIPSWLTFVPAKQVINELRANEEQVVQFIFSVDHSAPVTAEQTLTFVINGAMGDSWNKEIKISIAPPKEFELLQNFPNPFNPETQMSFLLPEASNVKVTIFDLLGRELVVLKEGGLSSGYHTIRWAGNDAAGQRAASGVYLYRIVATTKNGRSFARTLKMILAR